MQNDWIVCSVHQGAILCLWVFSVIGDPPIRCFTFSRCHALKVLEPTSPLFDLFYSGCYGDCSGDISEVLLLQIICKVQHPSKWPCLKWNAHNRTCSHMMMTTLLRKVTCLSAYMWKQLQQWGTHSLSFGNESCYWETGKLSSRSTGTVLLDVSHS